MPAPRTLLLTLIAATAPLIGSPALATPALAGRAIQDQLSMQVFDETESVLVLAPARQVDWARAYASRVGPRASAQEIEAAVARSFPNDPPGMRVQTALIVELIIMGDIIGALRSYEFQSNSDLRRFSRELVSKLDRVRSARSAVIRNFARTRPPRAYSGAGPSQAARAQNRSARYTQYVRMQTQLMNELQNTERELVDALQSAQRNMQTLWESYAGFRDQEFRTNERVMTTR